MEKLKKMFGVPAHGYALAMAHRNPLLLSYVCIHFTS